MLNDNKELFDNNYYLNQRENKKKKIKFAEDSLIIFILAVFFSLVIIVVLYFISPYSRVFKVSISGNIYIKNEDIEKDADVNDIFLFVSSKRIENRLKENPLIKEVKVNKLNGNIVLIEIEEEKQIGYILEDNEAKLLLVNGERVPLNKDNMYLIDKVPLIVGYTKEELDEIRKGFVDVSYKTINELSEIHKYPISYDNEQMEVIMRDGNYCFLSSAAIKLLENYYLITSAIDSSKGNVCAYFDEITNAAYTSTCPWQIDEVEEVEEIDTEEVDEISNEE